VTERGLAWTARGWDEYLYWQGQDRRTLKRINLLIADILRGDPFTGIGKPESLRGDPPDLWSRRIDDANRLVYLVTDESVVIVQARYHY
jgi:toxin YoeB